MNFKQLLELYTLEEVLEQIGLEPTELLEFLDDCGYDFSEITEPLE